MSLPEDIAITDILCLSPKTQSSQTYYVSPRRHTQTISLPEDIVITDILCLSPQTYTDTVSPRRHSHHRHTKSLPAHRHTMSIPADEHTMSLPGDTVITDILCPPRRHTKSVASIGRQLVVSDPCNLHCLPNHCVTLLPSDSCGFLPVWPDLLSKGRLMRSLGLICCLSVSLHWV